MSATNASEHAPLPPGVELLLAPNPSLMTGPGTNTYLIADPADQAAGCVVIDPGPEIESHLAAVARAATQHGGAHAILITHGHPDHVEGAARLRALTGAPVLAWSHEGSAIVDETLTDGQVIGVGARQLHAVYTPGHRFDHLCFLLEDAGALFAGDLVAGVGTVVIIPPEGDMLDYLASLRRLLTLDLRVILPAHGPQIVNPHALLEDYLRHREAREAQVIAALAASAPAPQTVPALVTSIYTDVDPQLHPIAAHSVLAHLLKLEREGRARRLGETAPHTHGLDAAWELTTQEMLA
ncbi:MAG TPA: MBL fold metallo-hydrolase [Ktedonobacterales bacterium]|nr:MBL fold metallo-hydrolase [Ktedonobacterales bacterium]